jgi:hypothetical protein
MSHSMEISIRGHVTGYRLSDNKCMMQCAHHNRNHQMGAAPASLEVRLNYGVSRNVVCNLEMPVL